VVRQLGIAQYLIGRIGEEEFIKPYESAVGRAAQDNLCIASYFAGMRSLLEGHRDSAIQWLRQAVRTGASTLLHYHAAESELRQLKALPSGLGLPPHGTSPERIMVFSFDQVNAQSNAFKAALAQFQAEDAERTKDFERWQAEIASLKTELERATKMLAGTSGTARAAAEKEVAARREAHARKEQAFVSHVQDVASVMEKRSLELAVQPNALVAAVARAYAEEKGFEYVCDATGPGTTGLPLLPLGMKGTDVTAVLIERVNAPQGSEAAEKR
jgi:Skp family chaperone for outer membrane proteins